MLSDSASSASREGTSFATRGSGAHKPKGERVERLHVQNLRRTRAFGIEVLQRLRFPAACDGSWFPSEVRSRTPATTTGRARLSFDLPARLPGSVSRNGRHGNDGHARDVHPRPSRHARDRCTSTRIDRQRMGRTQVRQDTSSHPGGSEHEQ